MGDVHGLSKHNEYASTSTQAKLSAFGDAHEPSAANANNTSSLAEHVYSLGRRA